MLSRVLAGDHGEVSLHVFAQSSARRLYERLGFEEITTEEGRVLMRAGPGAGRS